MAVNVYRKRLAEVRALMKRKNLDALIVPSSDPHLGEYVPDYWRVIRWLTGFTGSAGTVVITGSFAGLWTDSRYFIQAEGQLAGSGYELVKLKIPHTPEHIDWLRENSRKGWQAGVDGRLISVLQMRFLTTAMKEAGVRLNLRADLISRLWKERPLLPAGEAFELDVKYAGITRREKLDNVRQAMAVMKVDFQLLTAVDDIMWLLNIRGNDVKYCPLLLSYALIGRDQVILFADEMKVPAGLRAALDRDGVVLLPYDTVAQVLGHLEEGSALMISPGTTAAGLWKSIARKVKVVEDLSIPTRMKAIKNTTELKNLEETMVQDGVVLTRFFYWLEKSVATGLVTELSAAAMIDGMRSEQEGCMGPTFSTIAAWNEHAALPHYVPDEVTNARLGRKGIFLLDSGGQYFGGTTDITRTVASGKPDSQMKKDFTLALRGTIDLAMARFPRGTKGYQLDILARKPLWDNNLNYGHGTGHGVGSFLNVHEGPQSIGTGATADMKTGIEPGMVVSDEPAFYRPGQYGFRTENLLVCREEAVTEYGSFLTFDTVTLCYIDSALIDVTLLDDKELEWLNEYHASVYKMLQKKLDPDIRSWLAAKTKPLERGKKS
ncbi:MAG: aminopeptidase P family protein [Bacteroidales bacterium]|jgi:Xaa-Pro aminopeptidase|nr:aminopeptidase P family protein [Bacteroidales bacterium]